MKRIKIFKTNKTLAWVLVVVGIFLALTAVTIFLKSQFSVNGQELGPWDYVPLFIQGILLIVLASFNLGTGKYYIEWDDSYLNYFLPRTSGTEKLEISRITGIHIGLFEIRIEMGSELRTLDLENVQFEEIKAIKSKFQELSQNLKA
jgi:hypothetical protein